MTVLYCILGYLALGFGKALAQLYVEPKYFNDGELIPSILFWPLWLCGDLCDLVEAKGKARRLRLEQERLKKKGIQRELEI